MNRIKALTMSFFLVVLISSCTTFPYKKNIHVNEINSDEEGFKVLIPEEDNGANYLIPDENGKILISGSFYEGTITWWDTDCGISYMKGFYPEFKNLHKLVGSPNMKSILTLIGGDLSIWDFISGEKIFEYTEDQLRGGGFITDDIIFIIKENYFITLNFRTGEKIDSFNIDGETIWNRAYYSSLYNNLIVLDMDNYLHIWDLTTQKKIKKYNLSNIKKLSSSSNPDIINLELSQDKKYILIDEGAYIFRADDGTILDHLTTKLNRDLLKTLVNSQNNTVMRIYKQNQRSNYVYVDTLSISNGRRTGAYNIQLSNYFDSACGNFSENSFFIGLDNGGIEEFDITNGNRLMTTNRSYSINNDVYYAADTNDVYIARNHEIIRYNLDTLTYNIIYNDNDNEIKYFAVNENGMLAFSTEHYNDKYYQVKLLNTRNNELTHVSDDKGNSKKKTKRISLSRDGKYLATLGYTKNITIRDLNENKVVKQFSAQFQNNGIGFIPEIGFSPTTDYFYYKDETNNIYIFDTETWKLIDTLETHFHTGFPQTKTISFQSDSNILLYIDYTNSIVKKDLDTNNIDFYHLGDEKTDYVSGICMSPDGNECLLQSFKFNTVKRYDFSKRDIIHEFTNVKLGYVSYSDNSDYLIFNGGNGSISYIDNRDNSRLYSLLDDDDWIIVDDDKGYFTGSSNCGDMIYIATGDSHYPIDQFSLELNRPDLMLEDYELGNNEVKDYYHSLFLRRESRLSNYNNAGISSVIPTSEILNFEIYRNDIEINFKLASSGADISSYQFFINNVPINKIEVDNELYKIESEIRLPLSVGKNKIELSCIDSNGIESYRDFINVINNDKVDEISTYYIGIGISEYIDDDLNLSFAAKDANDLEVVLSDVINSNFYSKVFINESVIEDDLFNEIREFLSDSDINDNVILFYAGHGIHDDNLDYQLLTSFSSVDDLSKNTLPYTKFEELLNEIKPRNKIFLIDACESGILDESSYYNQFQFNDGQLISRGIRGLSKRNKIEMNNKYVLQKNRYLNNDIARRSGAIVYSSCQGFELSYEFNEYENGLFTEALIETIEEMSRDNDFLNIDFLQDIVTEKVNKMSNGLQNPVTDRDNIYLDINIPLGMDN